MWFGSEPCVVNNSGSTFHLYTFKCDIVFIITTLFYNFACFGLILAGHHQRFMSITIIYTLYTV
jgi:hypothetical protein